MFEAKTLIMNGDHFHTWINYKDKYLALIKDLDRMIWHYKYEKMYTTNFMMIGIRISQMLAWK